jgi:hypothetical protein
MVLAVITFGISWLFYGLFGPMLVRRRYLEDGWRPVRADGGVVDMAAAARPGVGARVAGVGMIGFAGLMVALTVIVGIMAWRDGAFIGQSAVIVQPSAQPGAWTTSVDGRRAR